MMMMTIIIDKVTHKVNQAYYEDGLSDIFVGGLLMFISYMMIEMFAVAFVGVVLIFGPQALEGAKRRWVDPRIGYMKPSEQLVSLTKKAKTGFLFLFVLLPAGTIVTFYFILGFTGFLQWLIWIIPTFLGLIFSLGPIFTAIRSKTPRFLIYAAIVIMLGVMIPWIIPFLDYLVYFNTALMLMGGISGGIAIIVGALTYLRFVKRYPTEGLPEEEQKNNDAF